MSATNFPNEGDTGQEVDLPGDEIDMRRKLSNDTNTHVLVTDEPGEGGACHSYELCGNDDLLVGEHGCVRFQNGQIQESGVNGTTQENLLLICIDRLESFQAGPFPCIENEIALRCVKDALFWLNRRTTNRIEREVEGQSKA